ncbi:cell division protein FtsW [Virgisporangium aliadipatigenens]|uniref:Probable peptidoglycan glycosyltransferase FtsW n=1 Tax=Virgisporangium aliadipatigenens TaxID=741659 RepID=A0A8J4DT49_9ACTN|nr:putative peptidoglycan glycosyltransferase FtsW [Virgisporangium aliadipatigenens]GIJ49915.1 cell division protein FtsW [Virgisporangium aliadipatigenens]
MVAQEASAPAAVGPFAALRGLLARPLASYYLLLSTVGLLVLIGMTMVFSATSLEGIAAGNTPYGSIIKQLVSACVGLVAFWICQRLPVRTYRKFAGWALMVSVLLIALVDMLGVLSALQTPANETLRNAKIGPIWADQMWLHLGPVQLQPSELGKLAFAMYAADILARRGPAVAQWRELALPLFPVSGLLFLLVGYHDLGTMLILLAMFIGILWAAGVRFRVFGAMIALGLAGVTALVMMPGKTEYRKARLAVFLDPDKADRTHEGWQARQGLEAIGSGSWFGQGLGESRLKWGRLPNGHNDFIFALIAEELGVVGCMVVVSLFAVLAYTGLRIARRVDDPFRRLVAAALTTWLVAQAIVNIGGVTGLLPITGLPLPFISDGGSALVVALAAAGVLLSFARSEPEAATALHARPPRKAVQLLWAPLPPLPRRQDAAHPPRVRRGGSDDG